MFEKFHGSNYHVSIVVVISEGTIGFVNLMFRGNESETFEVCVELQETTSSRPLNFDASVTIISRGDTATGNSYIPTCTYIYTRE